jgi:16S rRNA (cytosine967-C5)-methyltransferase
MKQVAQRHIRQRYTRGVGTAHSPAAAEDPGASENSVIGHADSPALAGLLAEAARLVSQVREGKSLAEIPARATPAGGVRDLTYGTLRCYRWGPAIVAALATRSPDRPLDALLWCALYALNTGRYAAYTVVDQSVRACAILGLARAGGFVNGILRSYLRRRTELEELAGADLEAHWQHPAWWIAMLGAVYPDTWRNVLEAGNTRPPMCLRVNLRKQTVAGFAAQLGAAGIAARHMGGAALLLEHPLPVERLPGFSEGLVSVQDAGAQRAAGLLDLHAGQRVLDACAAPGGKAGHILEAADVALTALDADPARCGRIEQNLRRLGLHAEVRAGDAGLPAAWWDGRLYDRVLADVPCSSSGIVRRRPDIKWLRRESDVNAYAKKQRAMLDGLWSVLQANGKLLYATCSVFPAENEGVIEHFLARTPDARRLNAADTGQMLPSAEHDGFYYALLEKRA